MKGNRDDWYRGSGFDAETFETNDEERWALEQRRRRATPGDRIPDPFWEGWYGTAITIGLAGAFVIFLFWRAGVTL